MVILIIFLLSLNAFEPIFMTSSPLGLFDGIIIAVSVHFPIASTQHVPLLYDVNSKPSLDGS